MVYDNEIVLFDAETEHFPVGYSLRDAVSSAAAYAHQRGTEGYRLVSLHIHENPVSATVVLVRESPKD